MPRYDYECASGHVQEQTQPMDRAVVRCDCGLLAHRVVLEAPQVMGFAERPTREAPVPLSRFTEAHGEMLHAAERAGVEPPDCFGIAKDRVRRGHVQAIE